MNKSTKAKNKQILEKVESEPIVEKKPSRICKIPKSAKIIKAVTSKAKATKKQALVAEEKAKNNKQLDKLTKVNTLDKNISVLDRPLSQIKSNRNCTVPKSARVIKGDNFRDDSDYNKSDDEIHNEDSLAETYNLIHQFREFFKGKNFFGVNFDDLSDLSEDELSDNNDLLSDNNDDDMLLKHIREWKKKPSSYDSDEEINKRISRFNRFNLENDSESERERERERKKREDDTNEYELEFKREVEKLKERIAQHTTLTEKCDVPVCLKPKIAHTSHYLKIIDNFNQEHTGELMYIINIIWLNFQDIVLILKRKEELNKKKGKKTKKNELDDYVFRNVTEIYGQYSIDPEYEVFGIGFNRNKYIDD